MKLGGGKPMKPQIIKNSDELSNNIENFVECCNSKPELVQDLLRRGRCWIYFPKREVFGPAKFLGFKNMGVNKYQWFREHAPQNDSMEFDGRKAKKAIETVLKDNFQESDNLKKELIDWGENLFGSGFFEEIKTEKWEFIILE